MYYAAQQNQHHPAVQPADRSNQKKVQKVLSILQLLSGVVIGLFIAGIVAPSFLRSEMATNNNLVAGSIHTLTIGGVTFTCTLQNVSSAILGGLWGSLLALAIEFPDAFARAARNFLMFRWMDWKRFCSRLSGRPSGVASRKLA